MAKLICLLNNHNPISTSKCFAALDYHSDWIRKSFHTADVFLGCLELPFKQHNDFWIETDDYVLAMDGEILSWRDPAQGESQASRLLQLFRVYKEDLVRHVNGNFTILIWDRTGKTLFILNDRMGLRPFYFALYGRKICLASEVKAILADPDFIRRIQMDALVDLFTYEYVLGNNTLVNGIEVFPYASVGKIHLKNIRMGPWRYWDFEYSPDIDKTAGELEEKYVETFKDLLTQAVERARGKRYKTGLLLSGGLDSRMIASVVGQPKSENSIESFTFGESNSDDVRFARRISKKIGITHHYTGVHYGRLPEFFRKAVFYQDGMVSCNHCHYFHMLDELEEHVQVGLDGFIGDVLPRQMFKPYLGANGEKIYTIFSTINEATRLELFDGSLQTEIKRSRERFLAFWQESETKSPANPLDHFNLVQRQRKFINYGKISKRNHLEIRLPFTDYDIIDFCLKMPRDLRINNRLCKKIFFRFYPDLTRIPQAESGYLNAGRFQARLYQKINIIKTHLHWRGPLMDYDRYYRKFLRSFIRDVLLAQKFKNRGYFNYQKVEKILEEHFAGKANHRTIMGVLLTFELWCRFFLDGTSQEFP